MTDEAVLVPVSALRHTTPYSVPKTATPVDLRCDGNEGVWPPKVVLDARGEVDAATIRNYPSAAGLERALAARYDLDPEQVLVTAGADDALDRTTRAMLEPGRAMLIAEPTFEMIPRYAEIAGARIDRIHWEDNAPYPLDDALEAIGPETRHVALVTPNNPTGQVIGSHALRAIADAAPHALIVVDHAYIEFAPEADLTATALSLPNVVVVRTMSKAWGLAGLRIGYVMGSPEIIGWLRASGNPYAVSGPSTSLALARLEAGTADVETFVAAVQRERDHFAALLTESGARVTDSRANFLFARVDEPIWMRDLFAGLGISVRVWPGHPERGDAVRISCPGDEPSRQRIERAIQTLRPDAILFDMDGVMVDVAESYRAAIIATTAHFGVEITPEEVAAAKLAGDANNDWMLTQRLLSSHEVHLPLKQVTEVFEELYQGTDDTAGLREREVPLVTRALLEQLAEHARLGVVTGRPRRDAEFFLNTHELTDLFDAVVCMEDGPAKPSPEPVLLAMHELGATTAWMIGDTPDDVRAARRATLEHDAACTILPLGFVPPQDATPERTAAGLTEAGAGRVLHDLTELTQRLLP